MRTRFGGVGAWHARRNSAVFYVAEIVAAKMLLFFRKPATMGFFTIRGAGAAMFHRAILLQFLCFQSSGS